jgi:putative ABC transport system permease protein
MIPVAYNTGSLAVRKTTTATAVLGIGLVVFVLAAALMLTDGIKHTLGKTGRKDVGMVIRKGSDSELASNFGVDQLGIILGGPEVKRGGAGGAPLGLGEIVVVAMMEKVGAHGMSNVQIRGVADNVLEVRPETRIVAGQAAKPGTDEALVGAKLRGRFKNLEIGQLVELRKGRTIKITGVFEDGGSGFESEIWADVDTLRTAFGREGIVSSARAQLTSESAFDAFKTRIEQDKQLGLEAQRESDYYSKQSEGLAKFLFVLGTTIAVFFSVGAMIGAMITMYASVSSRHREVGTLRALGFSRRSVLLCFLVEAFLISVLGGILGCVASLGLGMVKFSMMNFATWSEIVFNFHPTAEILGIAMVAAVIMGLIGGFLPALQAALLSPIEAMRGE